MNEISQVPQHIQSRRAFLSKTALGTVATLTASASLVPTANADTGEAAKGHEDLMPLWNRAKQYTLSCLVAMPAADFTFKPTEAVRTFAEQSMHMATVSFSLASRLTEKSPPEIEEDLSEKNDVIAAVEAAFDYIGDILRTMTEKQIAEKIALGGQVQVTGRELFLLIRDHVTHHRGQMVVYLRLKGIEPPQYVGF